MNRLLFMLFGILIALCSVAQNDSATTQKKKDRTVELYGEVYDSFTKARLAAHVTIMQQDSTVIDTATCFIWHTNSFYHFKVPAQPQTFIIKGTLDGYEDTYMNYELRRLARNQYFELPRLLMKKKAQNDIWREDSLGGVVVRGTMVKMAYQGDTIIYNASAFKLPEGSMLDGLIRQLPGAELKSNGDIYINGEKVDYLTLNGKDFFKGNNKVVLDNLPYYTVQNLKAYHRSTKQSQLAGRDIEKKEFVMDVNLKREYDRGYLANVEAGGGLPLQSEGTKSARYLARMFGLYFTDHSRYTVFGNINNVNETREPGGEGEWSPSNMPQGLYTTKQAGFDISTEDADKNIEEQGSIRAEWSDVLNETRVNTESFTNNGSVFNGSWSESRQKDFRLSFQNQLTLKKPFTLYSRMGLDISDGKRTSASEDSTFQQFITNQSQRSGLSKYRVFNGSGLITYYQKLPWGDLLGITLNGSFNYNKPADTFTRLHTHYASLPGEDDHYERYADAHSNSYQWSASANYQFSLPDNWSITPRMEYSQSWQNNHNYNYLLNKFGNMKPHDLGWLPSTRDSLLLSMDSLNTDVAQQLTRKYSASVSFSKTNNDYYLSLDLPFSHIVERLYYNDLDLDTIAHRHSNEFTPSLNLYFWKGGVKYVSYSMQIERPEMVNIMPTDDTTDPLRWHINNPELKNHITHHLRMRYTHNTDSLKRIFAVWANARIDRNSWGTQSSYTPLTGSYIFIDENVNGNWGTDFGASITHPLDKKRLLLLTDQIDATYDHSVDFDIINTSDDYDDEMDYTSLSTVNNWMLHNRLQLQYQCGDLSTTFSGNITWRNSTGDRQGFVTINAFDFDYGASLTCTIPWVKVSLGTDIRMFSRRGYYSDMMNDNHLVWNAQLSRSFLKNKLTAKVQAFDLLHQLSNTQYSINAQGRTETWNNSIPRYVMLTLQYKFSKMPKK